MGLMQTFRRGMPAVIIGLIVMFIALIIYEWGYEQSGRSRFGSSTSTTAVASVNGEDISIVEFEEQVKDRVDMQRQQSPDAPVNEEQIREQVWQELVNERLISQAAKRLGVSVSEEELRQALLFDPPPSLKQSFMDSTGTIFMQKQYHDFMTNMDAFLSARQYPPAEIAKVKTQIKKVEKNLLFQKTVEAIQSVVSASAIPSPAEARVAFDEQRGKASGSFVMIDPASIPDSAVKVTDEEAKKYYDEHKGDYQQKDSREARYAMFVLNPSTADSSAINARLKTVTEAIGRATTADKVKVFEEFVTKYGAGKYNGNDYTPMQELGPELQGALAGAMPGIVIGPVRLEDGNYMINVVDIKDSGEVFVKASHILFRTGGANDDSVKAECAKVLAKARAGEDFGALATQYSADPGSAQRAGDLGYFKKGAMVKPFEEAAFGAPTGAIVGPVKSDFGYHIIKVVDRSSKSYKLRDLRFDPKVSALTKSQLRAKAQQFRDMLIGGGNIDSLGAKMKLQVLETGPIDRLAATAGSMRLTQFAYEAKNGEISDVYELQDGSLIVAQLTKVRKAGVMDFADAKQTIIGKLTARKKLDMIKARAEKLRNSLAAGDSLSKLTAIDSSIQVRTFNDATRNTPLQGVGFDYALLHAIFSLKPGQISPLVRGERGYYIASVSSASQPTDKDYEAEREKFVQQLVDQRRQQLFQDWLQKERERAEIVDYRNNR